MSECKTCGIDLDGHGDDEGGDDCNGCWEAKTQLDSLRGRNFAAYIDLLYKRLEKEISK